MQVVPQSAVSIHKLMFFTQLNIYNNFQPSIIVVVDINGIKKLDEPIIDSLYAKLINTVSLYTFLPQRAKLVGPYIHIMVRKIEKKEMLYEKGGTNWTVITKYLMLPQSLRFTLFAFCHTREFFIR